MDKNISIARKTQGAQHTEILGIHKHTTHWRNYQGEKKPHLSLPTTKNLKCVPQYAENSIPIHFPTQKSCYFRCQMHLLGLPFQTSSTPQYRTLTFPGPEWEPRLPLNSSNRLGILRQKFKDAFSSRADKCLDLHDTAWAIEHFQLTSFPEGF